MISHLKNNNTVQRKLILEKLNNRKFKPSVNSSLSKSKFNIKYKLHPDKPITNIIRSIYG